VTTLAVVLGFIGVALGALVTWLVARRTKSGRIVTSEAETLWEEAREMRKELRATADASHREHEQCKADLATQRRATADLDAEVTRLSARVRELEAAG